LEDVGFSMDSLFIKLEENVDQPVFVKFAHYPKELEELYTSP